MCVKECVCVCGSGLLFVTASGERVLRGPTMLRAFWCMTECVGFMVRVRVSGWPGEREAEGERMGQWMGG